MALGNTTVFREYIGATMNGVKLSDVPIRSTVESHLILSFAIDYINRPAVSPTNGQFNVFWDEAILSPQAVADFKASHNNVKVAVSIGGDSVQGEGEVYFHPSSNIDSWITNAVSSLTILVKKYGLDGIDINYERFKSDPKTFAECIGRLLTTLKNNKVISFASIAPFDDSDVQAHYQALWNRYKDSKLIDYVNFQFYGYPKNTTVEEFLKHFDTQKHNYPGANLLASYISDGSRGLTPEGTGFLTACTKLLRQNKLGGIFVWCADQSLKLGGFENEKKTQKLLSKFSGNILLPEHLHDDGVDLGFDPSSV